MKRYGLMQGRIQDFQLGGAHIKKMRRAKGGAKIFGVFRVKNHDFTPKNLIFSNFRGGARAGCAPLPESAPAVGPDITESAFFWSASGVVKACHFY